MAVDRDRAFRSRAVPRLARDGSRRLAEDLIPIAERLIGGNQHRSPFVAYADGLEQHGGLCLILADIGEVIEDQQVEAIERIDRSFEWEFAPLDL
jgi:hypothetical protein